MPSVSAKEERDGRREDPEKFYKRFRRLVEKAGILPDCRKNQYFEKPSKTRKLEKEAAEKRFIKKRKSEQSAQYANSSRAIPAPLILFDTAAESDSEE